MSYYVHPPSDHVLVEREREEKAKELVRQNMAEYAEETARMNAEQEALEENQRWERERQRRAREEEEREAARLADDIEREMRVQSRTRRVLAERGIEAEDVKDYL